MNFLKLIQKAQAQGADTLAAPTFPFTPPGEPTPTPDPVTDGHTILLRTDSASIEAQDRITVRIYIDTDGSETSGFSVNIDFDPEYFQVIDSDEVVTGTQVNYIDTTFEDAVNTVNNTSGIINLRAVAEEDNYSSLSRTVAEIEFIATKAGVSEIKIVQTSSNILSTSSVDVLDNVNSLNFNISAQSAQITPTDSTTPTLVPRTGISDHANLLFASTGGILLIITGLYLRKLAKREQNRT